MTFLYKPIAPILLGVDDSSFHLGFVVIVKSPMLRAVRGVPFIYEHFDDVGHSGRIIGSAFHIITWKQRKTNINSLKKNFIHVINIMWIEKNFPINLL